MSFTSSAALLREVSGALASPVVADLQDLRMSSRGLGWSALNIERRESRSGSRWLPHGSRRHLICVGLSNGRIAREAEGQRMEYELTPGYVEVIPAGTPIRWSWSTRICFSVLMLEPEFLARLAQAMFALAPESYRLVLTGQRNDSAINTIAGVLARETISRDPGGRLYAESLANILCVHLLRHYTSWADGIALNESGVPEESDADALDGSGSAAANYPRAVAEAVQLIERDYAGDLTLSEMAAAVHLSPFHLARVFKRALGVSPHQYLIQVRVNSARALLSAGSGQRSLAEIARAAGFADQSHLTRHFKRITGVTPSQFRT
jgi:AraC family transcriptional regulator